jgi:hypothetical protein
MFYVDALADVTLVTASFEVVPVKKGESRPVDSIEGYEAPVGPGVRSAPKPDGTGLYYFPVDPPESKRGSKLVRENGIGKELFNIRLG